MNQLRIDALQRLEALELLRPQVATVVANLSKQVIGDSFPLPPAKHANGQLAQDFEQELAIGYSAAAYDLCAPAGAVPFLRTKYVSQAVTRADPASRRVAVPGVSALSGAAAGRVAEPA